jgi:hypothetical protein
MKKLLLLTLILLVTSNYTSAQEYKKFINPDASWRVFYNDKSGIDTTAYESIWENYFLGDTLINDTLYNKMYRSYLQAYNNDYQEPYIYLGDSTLIALLREDTISKKVFGRFVTTDNLSGCSNLDKEELLYDFSLSEGDTVAQCNSDAIIESVSESTEYPKQQAFYTAGLIEPLYTEGIGFYSGPLGYGGIPEGAIYLLDRYCLGNPEDCGLTLTSVEELNPEQINISPNPFKESFQFTSANKNLSLVKISNAIGQEISFEKEGDRVSITGKIGVYFIYLQDGKTGNNYFKRVVKQ